VRKTLLTNLGSMFFLSRRALPHLPRGGAIINTASINAYQPEPPILDYASTKGGIVTFTKGLAQGLAERGIRVNAVAPGPVWTPLIVQSYEPEKVKTFGAENPHGRPAQPAELAPTYVFLASAESRFITGEVIGSPAACRSVDRGQRRTARTHDDGQLRLSTMSTRRSFAHPPSSVPVASRAPRVVRDK
jgi:NAD(P)-dependent dehydrogenase (short-subunit alcohol dehydrogenase family)